MEIHDTWRPGPDPDNNEVFDIAFGNNKVYAATETVSGRLTFQTRDLLISGTGTS